MVGKSVIVVKANDKYAKAMGTALKVPFSPKWSKIMATQPNPEFLQETMFADHGTKVLITNPKANKYLDMVSGVVVKMDGMITPKGGIPKINPEFHNK